MSISVAKMALVVLTCAACVVYGLNMPYLEPMVGGVIVFTALLTMLPTPHAPGRTQRGLAIALAFCIGLLGLAMVWGTHASRELHAGRVLGDIGWAQALLGVWLAYSTTNAFALKAGSAPFDDASRERWRAGDMRFGVELARRIVVRAQPSWAALVVETAWPEPRPETVTELLQSASSARGQDLDVMLERLRAKGGVGEKSEARWELARVACEVIRDARASEEHDDVGGPAVARFIVTAAGAVRDDEDAKRIFGALVLPAVARRA